MGLSICASVLGNMVILALYGCGALKRVIGERNRSLFFGASIVLSFLPAGASSRWQAEKLVRPFFFCASLFALFARAIRSI